MTDSEFNKIVEMYSDSIYRFVLKSLRDKNTAKDLMQDVYERVWIKRQNVNIEKAKSYLFTTAYHCMIDLIKQKNRFVSIETANIEKNETVIIENNYNNIKEIIDELSNKLPEIQKMVLMLRDYEDYSYEEIGKITGLTESQVKVYIYRARIFLKNNLKRYQHLIF
ncbi:MAG: RNA polymerase subunit sigma-24 [Bacteroidetes bacterium GWE2_29_8]|nr:MAG: RNA polymerase subunit sigma-24 [Bacteroidetes bacterium GWE2_29_8]OFY17402.1 MAG: RNA polymerase subunit sigma-24 [Bacteroidetes bacterium GWF2_29_10]